MHVVLFRNELNQLQRHDKGQDHARDGQNHIVRQRSDHAVDAAVPALGRSAHLSGDARHAAVHVVKQPVQLFLLNFPCIRTGSSGPMDVPMPG